LLLYKITLTVDLLTEARIKILTKVMDSIFKYTEHKQNSTECILAVLNARTTQWRAHRSTPNLGKAV